MPRTRPVPSSTIGWKCTARRSSRMSVMISAASASRCRMTSSYGPSRRRRSRRRWSQTATTCPTARNRMPRVSHTAGSWATTGATSAGRSGPPSTAAMAAVRAAPREPRAAAAYRTGTNSHWAPPLSLPTCRPKLHDRTRSNPVIRIAASGSPVTTAVTHPPSLPGRAPRGTLRVIAMSPFRYGGGGAVSSRRAPLPPEEQKKAPSPVGPTAHGGRPPRVRRLRRADGPRRGVVGAVDNLWINPTLVIRVPPSLYSRPVRFRGL
jgi:hypothetical protein